MVGMVYHWLCRAKFRCLMHVIHGHGICLALKAWSTLSLLDQFVIELFSLLPWPSHQGSVPKSHRNGWGASRLAAVDLRNMRILYTFILAEWIVIHDILRFTNKRCPPNLAQIAMTHEGHEEARFNVFMPSARRHGTELRRSRLECDVKALKKGSKRWKWWCFLTVQLFFFFFSTFGFLATWASRDANGNAVMVHDLWQIVGLNHGPVTEQRHWSPL